MKDILFVLMALLVGAIIPIQAATNSAFSKAIQNPIATALMVFMVGFCTTSLYLLVSKTALPSWSALRNVPVYGYLGGIILTIYIIAITFLAPKLGVAVAIGLIITGQVISALLIDHFGFFDVPIKPIDLKRLFGVLCMVLGIYLVMKK